MVSQPDLFITSSSEVMLLSSPRRGLSDILDQVIVSRLRIARTLSLRSSSKEMSNRWLAWALGDPILEPEANALRQYIIGSQLKKAAKEPSNPTGNGYSPLTGHDMLSKNYMCVEDAYIDLARVASFHEPGWELRVANLGVAHSATKVIDWRLCL